MKSKRQAQSDEGGGGNTTMVRKGDEEDEEENPVEADAIKKIISFLNYLAMRKGYWKLKQFLKLCTD